MTYKKGLYKFCDFLNNSELKAVKLVEFMSYSNYDISFEVNINFYNEITNDMSIVNELKNYLTNTLEILLNGTKNKINSINIKSKINNYLNYNKIESKYDISLFENSIARIIEILISVSTGVSRIEELNDEYISLYKLLDEIFTCIGYPDPNKFKNLWDAYEFWHNSSLTTTYASRRVYFSSLYNDVEKEISQYKKNNNEINMIIEYTGWEEINKIIYDIKKHFKDSTSIQEFNGISSMQRTLYIKLADLIYNNDYHQDDKTSIPDRNHYKDRFNEYIDANLIGKDNAIFRKFSKSTVDLADTITHDTLNVDRKKTETAIVAMINLVNLISIIEEKITLY